jgi:uncharacterized protein (DUF433 family)
MAEDEMRSEYWVDTRNDPRFPYWVVFRLIGHDPEVFGGAPYLRRSGRDLPGLLKEMELQEEVPALAAKLGVSADELRAALWYLVWVMEASSAPAPWAEWNRRVDAAWRQGLLG